MSIRAACRYSSRRCAESGAAATASRSPIRAEALLLRELRAIVVGGIAIDRVNVIDAALRRVFDHDGWPLDPEVRRAPVRRWSAPGEVGLGKIRPDLSHARLR